MSDPNPGVNFGGNIENSTIIFGDSNRADTSNEQSPGSVRPDEIATCDKLSHPFSVVERRRLRQTLNALPPSLFEGLVYDLAVPDSVFSDVKSSQPERCLALLLWAERTAEVGLAKVEESLIPIMIPIMTEQGRSFLTYLEYLLEGEFSQQTISELQPLIQRLRQITGDDSIDINFVEEGSIRMVLSGSSDGLKKLQDLYESGELERLDTPSVTNVQLLENNTASARKARLIDALKLSGVNFWHARASALASALAYTSDRASSFDLASDLAIDRARVRAIDLAIDLAIIIARDLDLDLDRDRAISIVRDDLDLDLDRDRAISIVRNLAIIIARARDRDFTIAISRSLVIAGVLYHARGLAIDRASVIAIDLARDLDHDLDRSLAYARARARDLAIDHDLTDADLKGANLSNLYLVGVDLTGTDLTGADVQGTVFGDNQGLSELTKRDLERRGAIFQDSPDSHVPSLVRV